ncbi:type VI secretion system membrane subunit TssM [Glacieibacterium megasporae]|uniref:type VI secretion system membrane subunit TssM n=1 Tax=Glacieibacterium megasporae TaxID=2835787 RepID=UPI001C1E4283|nr:type VI secretion system membrane subunit TssM [Polymorphobacter megasporae]UAJ11321.1 type VI secretion system membrane subunit TssM [Polymorphobacter megasporae]
MIAVGIVFLALFVWFAGPLVAIAGAVPLGSVVARLVTIAVILGVVGAIWGYRRWRTARRNQAMVDDLAAIPPAAPDDADEDVAAMNERAAQALALMKTTRVGKAKAFIYELPWYLIIGPPGAGKTTALQNAGLDFPVTQSLGDGPVRGIGGTRTIEWWFTDRAVLIDTAGRYTTQDSDKIVDGKAWTGLLDLLKRHRPRQPVTGIIVAISTTDLIGADEAAALAHGRAIRQRLNEVQTAFGLRVPVYVTLTKLDLLAGFTEFFDDLPQSEREQVWGGTFEFVVGTGLNKEAVDETTLGRLFDGLIRRLDERLLLRIQAEPDIARRGLVFGFPQQVVTLRSPLLAMMRIIARETKFEPTPLVRGFYLTSATQFGRPIDRLMNALSARIGVVLATPPGDGPRGRSYFLHDLLTRVVFPEAAIAGRDIKAERRRRAIRLAALGVATAAVVAATMVWTLAYLRNSALITRLEQRADILHRDVTVLGTEPVADSDPLRPLAVLNEARALPFGSAAPAVDRSPGFSWGIGREKALRTQVDGTYVNLLNHQFLPRLLLSVEGELSRLNAQGDAARDPGKAGRAADPRPAIYNLLRIYLMLGRAPGAPLERSAITSYFADRWADLLPAEEQSDTRAALEAHLDTLLASPMTPPALNATLITDARQRIGTLGPGERVYVRMLADQRLRDLSPFALTDVPGIANSRLFLRKSNVPLSTGLPGMFRHGNFYPVVLPTISRYAAQSADEGWVTGERDAGGAGIGRIKDALLTAYLADFTNRWDDFIDDIAVSGERPIRDRIQLATRPPSPVRSLFNTLASETNLTPPSLKQGSSGRNALQVASLFSRNIYRGLQRGNAIGSAIQNGPPGPAGPLDEVIAHFAWLRDMIPPGGAGPLDQALAALGDVGSAGGAAAAAAGMGNPALQAQSSAAAMAATAKLGTVSSTLPPQAGALFEGFVKASATQLNHDARDAVRGQYGAQLLPECQSIVKGGYPFGGTPLRQVSLDDFSRLFRPSGLLDAFQKTTLAGQIDTGAARWTLTPSGKALGLDPAAVGRFQDAAKISAAFFRPGDIRPNVPVTIELIRLAGAQSVTLVVGGIPATFAASGGQPVDVRWPGSLPGASIGFQRIPAPPAPVPPRTWPGEWGFAAMMHDLGGSSADRNGVILTVNDGALQAKVRLRIANNPFATTNLAAFQCPVKL